MSIVPWWYARAPAMRYAEPETCGARQRAAAVEPGGRTYLVWPDAEVVPVVEARAGEAERVQRAEDEAAGRGAVERGAREVQREVRVPHVLAYPSAHMAHNGAGRRTWKTAPPPLRRRTQGTARARAARRLTSAHGLWFRPRTTAGASR
jgi:hypothetical protein